MNNQITLTWTSEIAQNYRVIAYNIYEKIAGTFQKIGTSIGPSFITNRETSGNHVFAITSLGVRPVKIGKLSVNRTSESKMSHDLTVTIP